MSLTRWSPEEIDDLVAEGETILVDLRADWCTRCGPQEDVLERLRPEYAGRVRFGSVDVGEHPVVADDYGIQTIPSFLLFAQGKHQFSLTGYRRAPELREALRRLLKSGDVHET